MLQLFFALLFAMCLASKGSKCKATNNSSRSVCDLGLYLSMKCIKYLVSDSLCSSLGLDSIQNSIRLGRKYRSGFSEWCSISIQTFQFAPAVNLLLTALQLSV